MVQNKLKSLKDSEFKINKNLYLICGVITIFTMMMLATEFFSRCDFPPTRIPLFYLGILIIYSLHKEIVRWLGERKVDRQGEYFVYGWITFTLILYLVNFLSKQYFTCPENGGCDSALINSCILTLEVLAIFLITRASKFIKLNLNKKR